MNEWQEVNKNINKSKIFRFPYKKLMGESLTSFITKNPQLSYEDIRNKLLEIKDINLYLKNRPFLYVKFFENLKISVSSRKAEQHTYNNRK